MIGRLRGRLVQKRPPELLIEVNGLGYEVLAPMSTLFDLPALGEEVTLVTHFHVRDDAQVLYGFLTEAERSLFRGLIKVNGVGAKMALAVLSGMNPMEFSSCVRNGDQAALTRVPGIGKKTAERLIIEMRDRLDLDALDAPSDTLVAPATEEDPASEATQALVALGYKPQDATRMIRTVAQPGLNSEALIRLALKGAL